MSKRSMLFFTALASVTIGLATPVIPALTASINAAQWQTQKATATDYQRLKQQLTWANAYQTTPYGRTKASFAKLQQDIQQGRRLLQNQRATSAQIKNMINTLHTDAANYLALLGNVNTLNRLLILGQQLNNQNFGPVVYNANARAILNISIANTNALLNQANSTNQALVNQISYLRNAINNVRSSAMKSTPIAPSISLPTWATGQGTRLDPSHLPNSTTTPGRVVLHDTTVTDEKISYARYFPTALDIQRPINVQAITQAQQDELNTFTITLINQMRKQLGTPLLTTSAQTQKMENLVVNRYNRDNWDFATIVNGYYKGHDINGIYAVLTPQVIAPNDGYDEDMGVFSKLLFNGYTYPMNTVASVKWAIFQSIVGMIYDDASDNFGHTQSLLGLAPAGQLGHNFKNPTFSLNFDKYQNIHFLITGNYPDK